MAARTEFTIDDRAVDAMFNEGEPVGQHVAMIRAKVVFLAKRYVGKDTRHLERRISARTIRLHDTVIVDVIADTTYALDHHNGTPPHWITPNSQRVLRFKSGGRVVFAQQVWHPGTRPNPFLLRALREAVH